MLSKPAVVTVKTNPSTAIAAIAAGGIFRIAMVVSLFTANAKS
jgi:hypothetical protein